MNSCEADARCVAVIGMACRLPGASGAGELWELLLDGADATGETPAERYDAGALHSAQGAPGGITARRAGYVAGAGEFDAAFFGMSEAEAAQLDPQQRLLLTTAWEALEDAGLPPSRLAGTRTGVFVGNARSDYLENALRQGADGADAAQLGNFRSLLPARVSHFFDLRGPSVVVDTACSSSLVAVHQAVQSLRAGESPLALAAGVNLVLRPDEAIVMSQAGGHSHDGRSRFGDAAADGHAPADAVGVVVLKRLDQAIADGDRIRAVIRGSAVGNDGRTSDSVLNPSLQGQLDVLRWAYEDAGVDPADVDYVEAHGSGSPALDPLELTALGEVLGAGRPADRPLLVGSVKTNIGHGEAGGGIAGLIKTVLCLEHGRVPASINLSTPRPDLDWDALPLRIPGEVHDLPERTGRRALAGVSAQGSAALNAHVVLAEAAPPAPAEDTGTAAGPCVLALSARSAEALADLAAAYVRYLAPDGAGAAHSVRDICHSAALRRDHHTGHRLAVAGETHAELAAALMARTPPAEGPLADLAAAYTAGEDVDWEAALGKGARYVPVPGNPWRTRRYWAGERAAEPADDLAQWVLTEHARTSFEDGSTLTDIGIDSLAKLRIVVDLAKRTGQDVDPEELGGLRTVGELRAWTRSLQAATR
ncbi:polyketide synthase [Streptomyces roseirectus]|uniref:Polyketide synthase n=1 Tax=Streptomyces roseirectus TaxID=2768066 RepID=A0A7H0I6J9_9ACTN|nr:beta-ketoacyl synthase N-terminal-like domain-containing protein [Streptomyces roseirectus]QNP68415.1 polyketide synthase [Streptomyces roseirectus]